MKKIIFMVLALLLVFSIFANEKLELDTFFTGDDLQKIKAGELVARMYVKYNKKGENTHEKIDIPATAYLDEDFSLYEVAVDEKGFFPYKLTEKSKLEFYNTLSSFTKLEGMNYYSRRSEKVKKLVEKCYRVKSLAGKKYDDPLYDTIQPKVSNMFLQEDNKFGKLIYRSDLYNEGNNFVQINTCLEPVSKLIFHVNEKEEYKIGSYFIYDEKKQGFYYYSFLVTRVRMDFILKNGLWGPTAFSNRMRASTVQLAKLIGLDWSDKINAWKGKYDSYKK